MSKKTIKRVQTGEVPLFYCVHEKQLFHAPSIKELLSLSGKKPRIDAEGIAALALNGPGRPFGNAVLSGIKELPPGHIAEYENERLTITQYRKLEAKEHTESFEETAETVRQMLTDSVKSCLTGDMSKKCLFLSGGLDSSIIGAIMKASNAPVNTYSVDYTDNKNHFKSGAFQPTEDAPYVTEMRKFLKSEHRDVILDTKTLFGALCNAVIARGLPGMADVDASLYLFCEEVSKTCGYALSGECADETGCIRWGSGVALICIISALFILSISILQSHNAVRRS
ncbi:MAG: asparagine synthase-related protein [Oscillospiraceae bacterium]|nr:asparagine synthase-related protein [Oscillospiraceae bacterium]